MSFKRARDTFDFKINNIHRSRALLPTIHLKRQSERGSKMNSRSALKSCLGQSWRTVLIVEKNPDVAWGIEYATSLWCVICELCESTALNEQHLTVSKEEQS